MKNLLNFFIKYGAWFMFAFYCILSCVILFTYNIHQSSIYFSSANVVTSTFYTLTSDISGYFNLKEINKSLLANNARLENEVLNLKHQLAEYRTLLNDSLISSGFSVPRFDYINATVINNSIRHPKNYFSIDKGEIEGVKPGQGVVDHNGVVGIVNVVGPNTARVISLLNQNQKFSVKIKGSQFIGSLSWKGNDPTIAYMEELPRHAIFKSGDTIVTSGYSLSFPADIPVGTVMNRIKSSDDNFFVLKIRLLPDFKTLESVRIINDNFMESLDSLAQFDDQDSLHK